LKKSIIAAGVGAFVVITTLLCVNSDGKLYQKQKHFDTVSDVLTQLETNKILELDSYGKVHETNDFKECLSKRKRLTYSQVDFQEIHIEKIEELDEQKKKSLIEDYNKAQERLDMPYKPTKIEAIRLDIKGTFPHEDDDNRIPKDFIIDLVMVDEGEGMVIDYYIENYIGNNKNDGKHINVKG